MALTEFQKAFLKNILISKDSVIDPETGEALDWGSLGGDGDAEPAAPEPRYGNPYSQGERRHLIAFTGSHGTDLILSHSPGNHWWFGGGHTGMWVQFVFPERVRITEFLFVQDVIGSQGTFQVKGSNNGSDWTDLGDPVPWGTAARTQAAFDNEDFYTHYRLEQVTGAGNSNAYQQYVMFKIATETP